MSVIDIIARFKAEGTAQAKDLAQSIESIDKASVAGSANIGNLGKVMQFGLAAGAGLAVAGVGLLAKGLWDSVGAAAEAQQVQAQLAAVLESTGGAAGLTAEEVNKIASSLAEVTTFGDDAILTGQNLLLTFTGIGEDVFPRATETMLDMATALGTDAAGSAIQLGKALNDPIQGITALTRVGVSFSTEQKEMIRTLQESGDLMGAQTIILDELAKEFGGSAAAAAATFSGRMAQLKDRVGEAQEAIGGAFLPALTTLAEEAIPALQEATEELVPVIQELATDELPALVDGIKGVLGVMPELVGGLLQFGDAMEQVQKISPQYWFSQLGGAAIDAAGELFEVDNRIRETTTVTGIYGQSIQVSTVALQGHTRELVAEGNAYDYLIPKVEAVTTSTQAATGAYDFMIAATIRNENRMEHYGETLGETEETARAFADTLSTAVVDGMERAGDGAGNLFTAWGNLKTAQEELAASPWSQELITKVETAEGEVTAAFDEMKESHRLMVVDILIQQSQLEGGFTTSQANIMVAMGLMEQAEADLRLESQETARQVGAVGDALIEAFLEDGSISRSEAALLEEAIKGVEDGSFTAGQVIAAMARDGLGEFISQADTAWIAADRFLQKVEETEGDYQVNIHTNYTQSGEPPPGLGGGAVGGAGAGGGATGNPYGSADGAHGLDFVVPPGFPNDSFRVNVQSGEHVQVTPAGQSAGGGDTYYITIDARGAAPGVEGNIMRGVEYVMREHARASGGQRKMR